MRNSRGSVSYRKIVPTPEEIGLFDTTSEKYALFLRSVKIPKNVVSDGHMVFARALDIC